MKKLLSKCLAAYLIASLTFGMGVLYAFDDDDAWGDFDASQPLDALMPEPEPEPDPEPILDPAAQSDPEPSYGEPTYGEEPSYEDPALAAEPEEPSFGSLSLDEDYSMPNAVDQSSINFIKVVRKPDRIPTEYQNAIIEGLQVSVEKGKTDDEVYVTCYFIFRDKPTSYFYDINRKDKKLVFEFVDTRIGSSPIAAIEQAPLKEIVIEETQLDANKDVSGIEPDWHDVIRFSFHLDKLPVFSVSEEHSIISFKYKWTTNPENEKQYIEKDRFPLVFWLSGGVLGAIGIGTLTYFLLPKKEPPPPGPLSSDDLPRRDRASQ